jgi:hypothetical protein
MGRYTLERRLDYKPGSFPQIEIHFYTPENALRAVKLLAKPEIETLKIAIQEMFFAGNGRMLTLKFSPSDATRAEFLSYVSAISSAVSLVHPASMRVTIPE